MYIELKPGEVVQIGFANSDGEISVAFKQDVLAVHADLPDSSGRQGIILRRKIRV